MTQETDAVLQLLAQHPHRGASVGRHRLLDLLALFLDMDVERQPAAHRFGRKGLDLSPEGHWGAKTQRAIGKGLAGVAAPDLPPDQPPR